MKWVDELWPEDADTLYDVRETSLLCPAGAATSLVTGNPQRVGIAFSSSTFVANTTFTTSRTAAVGQGIPTTSSELTVYLVGYGFERLASKQWFCRTSAAAATITTMEIILNRPASRPAVHNPLFVRPERVLTAGELVRDYLRRTSEWRGLALSGWKGNGNGRG